MTIYVDTREKPDAIAKIIETFDAAGVEVIHQKLDEGDYATSPDSLLVIDRKQNLAEVCANLTWQHERFQRELRRAELKGKHLTILVEHGGTIHTLDDVKNWKNPRTKESPYAVSGKRLHQLMLGYAARYHIDWQFCDKRVTGKRIIEILTGGEANE